jgi:hypothetical protein
MRVGGVDLGGILDSVAATLAHQDAETQAEFLRVFAKELVACCGTKYQAEMQLAWVRSELTEEARDLLTMLGENP